VRFSHLVHGNYQFDIFNDTAEQIQLYQAMDKLRNRFGRDIVKRAVGMDISQRADFNPFNGRKT